MFFVTNKKIILNIFLRFFSILPRLVLFFFLTKKFSINENGQFNLFTTTIILLTFIFGLDFYNYCNRKLIQSPRIDQQTIIQTQLFIYLIAYMVLFPLYYFVGYKSYFSNINPIFFFVILISEHFSQEIFRILNVINQQVISSIILLIRSSFWILLLFIFKFNFYEGSLDITINEVIDFWVMGSVITLLLSIFLLQKKMQFKCFFNIKFDIKYLKSLFTGALRVTFFYLSMTICLKFIEYSGRYIATECFGFKIAGVYTIFYQIIGMQSLFVESSVAVFSYPTLMNLFAQKKWNEFSKEINSFLTKTIIITSIISLLFIVFRSFVFDVLNKELLKNYEILLITLLANNFIYTVSNVYNYGLYSMEKDKYIFISTLISMLINVILVFSLLKYTHIYSIAIASLVTSTILFVSKYYFFKKSIMHCYESDKN